MLIFDIKNPLPYHCIPLWELSREVCTLFYVGYYNQLCNMFVHWKNTIAQGGAMSYKISSTSFCLRQLFLNFISAVKKAAA